MRPAGRPHASENGKPERLKRRQDFVAVAEERRRWVAPGLVLQVRRHPEATPRAGRSLRVGFTVSRKVGGAVVRNRVRRRLRALAAELMPRLAAPGHDYVLIGRAATEERSFAALKQDLETALKHVGALRRLGAGPASEAKERAT